MGGVRATDVRDFLDVLDHAYNSLVAFEATFDRFKRLSRDIGFVPYWIPFAGPVVVEGPGRPRLLAYSSWPPPPSAIAAYVRGRDRLILNAAHLHSPGFLEFLGKLNPLEVVRQYLVDRHERRKDRDYKEAAEQRRLELENKLLENKVLKERIEIAQQLGATQQDLAPLLNELVLKPLHPLGGLQDFGLIEGAEIVEGEKKG